MIHPILKKGSFFLILMALPGCLVTDQHLPLNEPPSNASPFMGLWQSPWPAMLTRETLNVSYVPGKDYFVAVRGRGKYMGEGSDGKPVEIQETMTYEAYPHRVGERLFFSTHVAKNADQVFAIVEAVLEDGGKRLIVREPRDEVVAQAIADGKLSYRMMEDSKLVTSKPEAVAAWLVTLSPSDFKDQEVFERWPQPVDDLKQRLENHS